MEQKNLENRKFHEILTLVTSEAIIFNEFSSLTRISLPRGDAFVHIHDSWGGSTVSSNTVTGQDR